MIKSRACAALAAVLVLLCAAIPGPTGAQPRPGYAPTAKDWADLAKLPDLTGIWTAKTLVSQGGIYVPMDNLPSWTPAAARRVAQMLADEKAGHPQNFYLDCLPEGMPGFVVMTQNAMEFLVTPGRITVLGEADGNRLRRIWTDGRGHPDDPDLTFNGHSIGRWEGETLVVDTVAILPQVIIPIGLSVGVPNNGDMHVIEHIRLTGPDTLQDEVQIIAPKVLTKPWIYTRTFTRRRDSEIEEASCRQGDFTAATDADGFAVFRPLTRIAGGAPTPTK